MTKVLFVCTGNICRSPTAEGVFRHLANAAGLGNDAKIESAGTHSYHVGNPPDPRTVRAAANRGIDLSNQRARRVRREDFHKFDLILAMDRSHLEHLRALRPKDSLAEVRLFLDYHPSEILKDVPDPYYGGDNGFEDVLDMIEQTITQLIKILRQGKAS
ncbi:MAG TPA: phosphotyrosine protein phosphatase [Rhodospirillaceae bacterium]|nr:phosphotyrosine protein phosphatase [Candidatus Neomarinimicrobiota bacterium]HCX15214.1 phosphotyrosine protein phosphatase [Rhodospirillaceae bacterium]